MIKYIKDNDLTYLTNVLDLIGASEWKEIKDEFLFEDRDSRNNTSIGRKRLLKERIPVFS